MNNYNFIQVFIHYIFYYLKFLNVFIFELEKLFFLKRIPYKNKKPIFIMGLARSRTTIVLEAICRDKNIASLSYRDMPFITATNIWKKFNFFSNTSKRERAHLDGIKISTSSVEAFEEIYWSSFNKKEGLKNFIDYFNLVAYSKNKTRYVSKNNQNIKRIFEITKLLPSAKIVIIYRSPFDQASSLLKQHKYFLELSADDTFVKKYFDMTCHYEFGPFYRPIINSDIDFSDPADLNHWLEQWYRCYSFLYNNFKDNDMVYFVCSDKLNNAKQWKKFLNFLNIDYFNFTFDLSSKYKKNNYHYNNKLLNKCLVLFNQMK